MPQEVTVRFYAAAADAAGTQQVSIAVNADPTRLEDFLASLPKELPQTGKNQDSAPNLTKVCDYSSFLINAVQARRGRAVLSPGDTLDILPPFAGG